MSVTRAGDVKMLSRFIVSKRNLLKRCPSLQERSNQDLRTQGCMLCQMFHPTHKAVPQKGEGGERGEKKKKHPKTAPAQIHPKTKRREKLD